MPQRSVDTEDDLVSSTPQSALTKSTLAVKECVGMWCVLPHVVFEEGEARSLSHYAAREIYKKKIFL